MIIASVDIETTGLDPNSCQVIEVGLVLWESTDFVTPVDQLPTLHCYVVHDGIRGQAQALAMNAKILDRIAKREEGYTYLHPGQISSVVRKFLADHGVTEMSIAGFNVDGFDRQFLNRLAGFSKLLGHRSLSPASLFFDPMVDVKIPSSDEVFRRAGVRVENRHTALGDARATIEVLRAGYRRGGDGAGVPAPTRCPDCNGRGTIPSGVPYEPAERCITCCPTISALEPATLTSAWFN